MKIVLECPEIGIASLVEAVQNKANEYREKFNNESEWSQIQIFYRALEKIFHNILIQIVAQVNGEGGASK